MGVGFYLAHDPPVREKVSPVVPAPAGGRPGRKELEVSFAFSVTDFYPGPPFPPPMPKPFHHWTPLTDIAAGRWIGLPDPFYCLIPSTNQKENKYLMKMRRGGRSLDGG
ncbi:UNVERIFIED_CONTAM: hypothetical protein K2H54_034795, partial [Gekko kuhli]